HCRRTTASTATTSAASSKPSPTASTRSRPPRSVGEAGAVLGAEVEVGDAGDGVGAHLLQGLLDDAVELVALEARGEVVELGLEEDETERVLERLHLGVLPEAPLAHEVLHAGDRGVVVADT